jgi:hypothetical protein
VTGDARVDVAAPVLGLYERLVADLEAGGARYRLIDHAPEGAPIWSAPCVGMMSRWPPSA